MKRLTLGNQLVLGVLMMGLGHFLSWSTSFAFFRNLGWIAFGLLFVIHPVWSADRDHIPHIKSLVRLSGVIVILMGCLLRIGGPDDFWQRTISEELGIDVSGSVVVASYDDHSGFHGDGTSYAVLSFEDDTLEQMISAPGGWNRLPLNHNLQTLIYGTRTETQATGPFLGITFPRVQNGYWYFYDRQGETAGDDLVLTRGSYNYTFAVYDAETDQLYYCEYDT